MDKDHFKVETEINIRECATLDELAKCVELQREVFALPEVELSPVRHFVVTKNAGGFALGAFSKGDLVGFVLSVPAFLRGERAFYSHMTAVKSAFQSSGVGARLKWAQRELALQLGVKFVKWTFEPAKARNAYFNLEKLGAIVTEYQPNFYGTDYSVGEGFGEMLGLDSDRLFAEWRLDSAKVCALAAGERFTQGRTADAEIVIPPNWQEIVATDPESAKRELARIRTEFQTAFSAGLFGRGFSRSETEPKYILYMD